jgi:hypothetical protein
MSAHRGSKGKFSGDQLPTFAHPQLALDRPPSVAGCDTAREATSARLRAACSTIKDRRRTLSEPRSNEPNAQKPVTIVPSATPATNQISGTSRTLAPERAGLHDCSVMANARGTSGLGIPAISGVTKLSCRKPGSKRAWTGPREAGDARRQVRICRVRGAICMSYVQGPTAVFSRDEKPSPKAVRPPRN